MLVIIDPTPASVAFEVSPRSYAWTERCEDMSGLEVREDDWVSLNNPPETLLELLAEIGRVYAPFLLANAAALQTGADKVVCRIDGQDWEQGPFVYQGKCLRWLREAYAAMPVQDQKRVDAFLEGTGCEPLFAGL